MIKTNLEPLIYNPVDLEKLETFSDTGKYVDKSVQFLEKHYNSRRVLLTSSGSAALEICSQLLNLMSGDEVIVSSFSFPTSASPFLKNGSKLVFSDIDVKNMCLEIDDVEAKITKNTKVIVVTHYASYSCDMERLKKVCSRNNIILVEDAATAIMAKFKDKILGCYGDMAIISFNDKKNIHCGEGGALLVKNKYYNKAKILCDRGTNRQNFINKKVKRYRWVELGFNASLSNIHAFFLYGHLKAHKIIINQRKRIWNYYHKSLFELDQKGVIRIPKLSPNNIHNAHNFHIILKDKASRDGYIKYMAGFGIICMTHYEPLHNSRAALKYKDYIIPGECKNTIIVANRMVRLPLWSNLGMDMHEVVAHTKKFFLL